MSRIIEPLDGFGFRTAWLDHFTNGGTAVTKTSGEHTKKISASVEAFGDPQIFMKGSELHTSRSPVNLSDFWEFHYNRLASESK